MVPCWKTDGYLPHKTGFKGGHSKGMRIRTQQWEEASPGGTGMAPDVYCHCAALVFEKVTSASNIPLQNSSEDEAQLPGQLTSAFVYIKHNHKTAISPFELCKISNLRRDDPTFPACRIKMGRFSARPGHPPTLSQCAEHDAVAVRLSQPTCKTGCSEAGTGDS